MGEDITERFEYHKPDEEATARIKRIRAKCKELAKLIDDELEPGREKALAITKLEEVSMWANKAATIGCPKVVD
jgi:hypothetical protein